MFIHFFKKISSINTGLYKRFFLIQLFLNRFLLHMRGIVYWNDEIFVLTLIANKRAVFRGSKVLLLLAQKRHLGCLNQKAALAQYYHKLRYLMCNEITQLMFF